ncbi:MAG: hypothetical protein WCK54_17650 [Desulfuromonadales bacterium]
MRSPGSSTTIQIDITNACFHQCSNCTRFCGHHKKPFFMDYDTFTKAVDSLEEYPYTAGIMGGEPTLHPDFVRFVNYLADNRGPKQRFIHSRTPTRNFIKSQLPRISKSESRRGLWTALGPKYYDNFETIQDVFEHQVINDHIHPGVHQALLISRKDLGIPDDDWIKLRDNCWLQNSWSGSITPKGAFFCEVAAAFDMLFDGPGGWPIEKGWWKREPADFGEQLNWCEYCSAALDVPVMEGNKNCDIISHRILELLKAVESPKIRRGRYLLFDNYMLSQYDNSANYEKTIGVWHIPNKDSNSRISAKNMSLFPKQIAVFYCGERTLPKVVHQDLELTLNQLERLDFKDWVIVVKENTCFSASDLEALSTTVLNPGCIYFLVPGSIPDNALNLNDKWENSSLILINRRALSLKESSGIHLGPELFGLYPQGKAIHLDNYPTFDGCLV